MSNPTTSLWKATSPAAAFPVLDRDLETDVVIIGGGITGITAADLLSRAGKRVVVLEAMCIGLGTTGHSTGNLHVTVDHLLHKIGKKWDRETVKLVAASRKATIDAIERRVEELDIPCGFVRCPHFLYPAGSNSGKQLEEEHRALTDAGIPATMTDAVPLPFPAGTALRIEGQAQFHPLRYVRGLAERIRSDNCLIFENSKVVDIDDDSGTVTTASGRVRAGAIFVATHTPKGFDPVQAELGPYREYGLASVLDGQLPPGIFWSVEEISVSIRSWEDGGRRYLMVIGEEHKTGQHREDVDYFGKVERFAMSHFKVPPAEYRWSAQNYRPDDLLPFIGKSAIGARYIATGFGTNGLVYGPLAAAVIADLILGKKNPLIDLFKPTRFTPVKSAKEFLSENLNVAKQYARDFLTHGDLKQMKEIGVEEGALVDVNGAVAVYRDEAGDFTLLSPICTHLGCKVHWNGAEKSWDCPCHGSRFHCEGEVLEGPAVSPLKLLNIVEDDGAE